MAISERTHIRLDRAREAKAACKHEWGIWKVIGYTGDWFHPHVCERECDKCGQKQTQEQ